MSQAADASPRRSSWRDVIEVHPACELFPLMPEAELRELGEDIRRNGLTSPIVILRELINPELLTSGRRHRLLDGRNRLDAMELVGIPFDLVYDERRDFWELALDDGFRFANAYADEVSLPCPDVISDADACVDPFDFVVAANIRRRHLNQEQRRELIAKVLKAKPALSNRQIAERTASTHPTVGKVRTELEEEGELEKLSTLTDTLGRGQPAHKTFMPSYDGYPGRAQPGAHAPPPRPNLRLVRTREEIADELIEELARAFHGVRDDISVEDLRAAFERRFPPP